jgi:NAD(P)-dependent dehydrogenase (short-subunit alcohol dehydrogenase family)
VFAWGGAGEVFGPGAAGGAFPNQINKRRESRGGKINNHVATHNQSRSAFAAGFKCHKAHVSSVDLAKVKLGSEAHAIQTRSTALVTGASRGIGAAAAAKLAQRGFDVALNYRNKGPRAEQVAAQIAALGGRALLTQADITNENEVSAMMRLIEREFAHLDALILNASGGLEAGKAEDYAMTLNLTAQMSVATSAAPLLRHGGRIVFVTSHWAHFFGTKPVMPEYEQVAKSKRAGENALRVYSRGLAERGITLVVVSGDAIEGTITPKLLERKSRGRYETPISEARHLPTIDEFAEAIAAAAVDRKLVNGDTIFVGSTDY